MYFYTIILDVPHPFSFEKETLETSNLVDGLIRSMTHVKKPYGHPPPYGTNHYGNLHRGDSTPKNFVSTSCVHNNMILNHAPHMQGGNRPLHLGPNMPSLGVHASLKMHWPSWNSKKINGDTTLSYNQYGNPSQCNPYKPFVVPVLSLGWEKQWHLHA